MTPYCPIIVEGFTAQLFVLRCNGGGGDIHRYLAEIDGASLLLE